MICPICKTPVRDRDDPQSPNAFFPFCSDRCKLIDLGRWLGGKYQIPVTISEEDAGEENVKKSR
ncbi:MAG TPA: DNA gyrase inhibitor YacG [Tepidisphaeraceae bacterium]|nr:DNA gyrase inhibitor YacG [Tepidisphaeraceae bacterium]